MTFFAHRVNYRAWAAGPSNIPNPGRPQWLDLLAEYNSAVQTMFWRPDRTGDVIRVAFGMEYLVLRFRERSLDNEYGDLQEWRKLETEDIPRMPESCEQKVSVYIQLKKESTAAEASPEPSLGLAENSMIIFDTMRSSVTRDELLDGVLSWKRLMYDADVKDPFLSSPIVVAAIRLIFHTISDKWSEYILRMQNYIVAVEETIYSQPANDKFSPLLWKLSKRLLQAERLLKFHIHLLETVQVELTDITGPGTMEPDWLRQNLKEYARLSSEVEESLRKPVAQMVDLVGCSSVNPFS